MVDSRAQDATRDGPVTREQLLWLAAIVAIAVVVRVAWIAYANVSPLDGRFDDTVFYYSTARSLAEDFAYRDNFGRLTAHWPPGYSLALAPFFAVSDNNMTFAKMLNVASAAVIVVLTFVLGRRAFGATAGLVAAGIVALLPGHIFFATLLMTEVFFGALFLLFVWLLSRWTVERERARVWHLLVLGVVLGAATLTRSEAVFLAPAVVLLWAWMLGRERWRDAGVRAAIFGAAFALTLAPWALRNYDAFDEFIPLRDDPGGFVSIALERDYKSRVDRFQRRSLPLDETWGDIKRHPWEIVPLELEKLRHLYKHDNDGVNWLQHERPLLTQRQVQQRGWVANPPFFAMLALALAAAPLWLRRNEPARVALAFALLSWTLIEIIGWPDPRYHLPVTPVLAIFAAGAVMWVMERIAVHD